VAPDCEDATRIETLKKKSQEELWGLDFEEFAQFIGIFGISALNDLEEEILFCLEAN